MHSKTSTGGMAVAGLITTIEKKIVSSFCRLVAGCRGQAASIVKKVFLIGSKHIAITSKKDDWELQVLKQV